MTDASPNTARRMTFVMWGRILSLIGALGLCVTIFLPHYPFESYTAIPVSPSRVVDSPLGLIRVYMPPKDSYSVGQLLFVFPFLAASMLAPLLIVRLVSGLGSATPAGRALAWVQCAVCHLLLLLGLSWFGYVQVDLGLLTLKRFGPVLAIPAAGLVGLIVAIVATVLARPLRKAAACLLGIGIFCQAFFTYFVGGASHLSDGILYGMWLSFAAGILLVLGAAVDWFQSRPVRRTPR